MTALRRKPDNELYQTPPVGTTEDSPATVVYLKWLVPYIEKNTLHRHGNYKIRFP